MDREYKLNKQLADSLMRAIGLHGPFGSDSETSRVIRREILLDAVSASPPPATVRELIAAIENTPTGTGDMGRVVVASVRARARQQPDLPLEILASDP